MGAGSTKGVSVTEKGEDEDIDSDRFSVTSHESLPPVIRFQNSNSNNNRTPDIVKVIDQTKPSVKIAIQKPEDVLEAPPPPPPPPPDPFVSTDAGKKKGLFGFTKKKEEEDKTSAFVHDQEEETAKKASKKESSKGFKFFNFKKEEKKATEKDEHLDQEIKDLQRTFDSLGIVGRSIWEDEGGGKSKKSQSADDIRNLEPMRNRMNARRRMSRTVNENAGACNAVRKGSGSLNNSSNGSRRIFKYSWETENESSPIVNDEWTYQAVVIEGFDIEKFKQANFQDSLLDGDYSRRITNSRIGDSPLKTTNENRSPLIYDTMEQKLLATIERDFTL